ncbi:MAG TPA: ATP-binding protein [Magnetospirillaceae bacterium]|nr:ATP-binding protein [Magnetospirillaceae bacterium]
MLTRVTRSSALTLAMAYVALGMVALALFALPLWYAWRVTIENYRVQLIQEDVQRFTEVFSRRGADGLAAFIDERVGLQIAGDRLLLLADPALKPLAGNLGLWPVEVPARPGVYTIDMTVAGRLTRVGLVRATLPGDYNLLVGRDLSHINPLEDRFWLSLATSLTVLLGVGLASGWLVRRAVMSEIDNISRSVGAIVHGDLSHRLPVTARGSEFDTLSGTINRMFDQIEQLVHGVRNVSNSIAHDLRTPLAELRSRLEEMVVTRPSGEELHEGLADAVEDVDRVIGIFNALLRLAEIDAGAQRSGFVEVNPAELASRAAEFYRPAAELKGISLDFRDGTESAKMLGDPLLLSQAVFNLIDNAVKFTPSGGHIRVAAERGEQGLEISVGDDGPGIPGEEKQRVVERFYRGDLSRGSTPGVGLGLTLVSAIASLHGGRLDLADNHPGLIARMVFDLGSPGAQAAL